LFQEEYPNLTELELKQECLRLFKHHGKKMKKIWWLKGQIDQGLKSNLQLLQLPQLTGLSQNQLSSYSKLVSDLTKILQNWQLCRLMILLSVSQSIMCPTENRFSGLHSIYLKVFWRKLRFQSSKSGERFETKMADAVVYDLMTRLIKVKYFCEIFAKA
jgi:hypothetical protein